MNRFGPMEYACVGLTGLFLILSASVYFRRHHLQLQDCAKLLLGIFNVYDLSIDVLLCIYLFKIVDVDGRYDLLNVKPTTREGRMFSPLVWILSIFTAVNVLWGVYSFIAVSRMNHLVGRWIRQHFRVAVVASVLSVFNASFVTLFTKQVWRYPKAMPMPKLEVRRLSTVAAILIILKDLLVAATLWGEPQIVITFLPLMVFSVSILCIFLYTVFPLAHFLVTKLLIKGRWGRHRSEVFIVLPSDEELAESKSKSKEDRRVSVAFAKAGNVRGSSVIATFGKDGSQKKARLLRQPSKLRRPQRQQIIEDLKELEGIIAVDGLGVKPSNSNQSIASVQVSVKLDDSGLWDTEHSAWKKRRMILSTENRPGRGNKVEEDLFVGPTFAGRALELERVALVADGFIKSSEETVQSRCIFIEGETGIGKTALALKALEVIRGRGGLIWQASAGTDFQLVSLSTASLLFVSYFGGFVRNCNRDRRRDFFKDLVRGDPDIIRLLPLINPLVDTGYEETDFTRNILAESGSLKQIANIILLLLQNHFKGPFITFFVDNLQWCDVTSVELFIELIVMERPKGLKTLFVFASRPVGTYHSREKHDIRAVSLLDELSVSAGGNLNLKALEEPLAPEQAASEWRYIRQVQSTLKRLSQTTHVGLGPLGEKECQILYSMTVGKRAGSRDPVAMAKMMESTGRVPLCIVRLAENVRKEEETRHGDGGEGDDVSRRRGRSASIAETDLGSLLVKDYANGPNDGPQSKVDERPARRSDGGLDSSEYKLIMDIYIKHLWREEIEFLSVCAAMGSFIEIDMLFNVLVKVHSAARLPHMMNVLEQVERKNILVYQRLDSNAGGHWEGYHWQHSTTREFLYESLQKSTRKKVHLAVARYLEDRVDAVNRHSFTQYHLSTSPSSATATSPDAHSPSASPATLNASSPSDLEPQESADELLDHGQTIDSRAGYVPYAAIARNYESAGVKSRAIVHYVVAAEYEVEHNNGRMALQCLARARHVCDSFRKGSIGSLNSPGGKDLEKARSTRYDHFTDEETEMLLPESLLLRVLYLSTVALIQCGWLAEGSFCAQKLLLRMEYQMSQWRTGQRIMAATEVTKALIRNAMPSLFCRCNEQESLFWAGSLMRRLFVLEGLGNLCTLSGLCWTLQTINLLEEYILPTRDLLIAYGHAIFSLSLNPSFHYLQESYVQKGRALAGELNDPYAMIEFQTFLAGALINQGMIEKAAETLNAARAIAGNLVGHARSFAHLYHVQITAFYLTGRFTSAAKVLDEELEPIIMSSEERRSTGGLRRPNFAALAESDNPFEHRLHSFVLYQCYRLELALRRTNGLPEISGMRHVLMEEVIRILQSSRSNQEPEPKDVVMPSRPDTTPHDFRLLAHMFLFLSIVEDIRASQVVLSLILTRYIMGSTYGDSNSPDETKEIKINMEIFDEKAIGSEKFRSNGNNNSPEGSKEQLKGNQQTYDSPTDRAKLQITYGLGLSAVLEGMLRLRSILPKKEGQMLEEQLWIVHSVFKRNCDLHPILSVELWLIEGVYAFIHTREVLAFRLLLKAMEQARKYEMRYHEGLAAAYIDVMMEDITKGRGEAVAEASDAAKLVRSAQNKIPEYREIAQELGCEYHLMPLNRKFWRGLFKLGKDSDK